MIGAFARAAAVWTVALCDYAVRGEFRDGLNLFAFITPAVLFAGLLIAVATRQRGPELGSA